MTPWLRPLVSDALRLLVLLAVASVAVAVVCGVVAWAVMR